jgi:HEAT repeat protein
MFLWSVDDRVFGPIVAALWDPDRQVRTAAALALGVSKKREAIAPLETASQKETDPRAVEAISGALEKLARLYPDAT